MGEQHGVYLRNAALTLAAILPEIRTKGGNNFAQHFI